MPFLNPFKLFILLYCGFINIVYAQKNVDIFTKKYSPFELKQDAELLKKVTFAMHPAVVLYHPLTHYDNLFNTYIQSLTDSLTEKQFCLKTKLVMNQLNCGHTVVRYSTKYLKLFNKLRLNYSPYVFLPTQNKVYVLTNLKNKNDTVVKKGTEVLKINGVKIDSMLNYCKQFISTDGLNETAKNHYIQLAFNSYFTSLFGRPDTFTMEYKVGKEIKEIKYPAINIKAIPPIPLGVKDDSLFTLHKLAKIKYRFIDNSNNTMLMKIGAFSSIRSKKAYRVIFRKIEKNKSENLIIDLRNNGGGSIKNAYRLLSYLIDTTQEQTLKTRIKSYPYKNYTHGNLLYKITRLAFKTYGKHTVNNDTDSYTFTVKPIKKNHYNKNIFVLINGGSFSASCLVAAYLKDRKKVVFIGEETGGALEGCNAGIMPNYKLPNTKIRVRMPVFRVINNGHSTITKHGIMPNYLIKYTINDILLRKDLELNKALELIRSEK